MDTKVIFVRHGQSDANIKKYFAGHLDAPLTSVGRKQAALMADYVKRYPISAVYASDLSRAADTAAPIASHFGLPVIKEKRIREICAGEWQGKDFEYLRANSNYNLWLTGVSSPVPKNGESIPDLFRRIDSFLMEIIEKHPGETVAIITHATPIRVLFAKWSGTPITEIKKIASPPNASVTVANCRKDGTAEILLFGENSFLGELSHATTTKM